MGQKINPVGFRLAVNRNWSSKWYANSRTFAPMLAEDIKVRDFLKKKLAHASVGRVLIERPAKDARITIFSAWPGVVIGKKGEEIESLKAELRRIMGAPGRTRGAQPADQAGPGGPGDGGRAPPHRRGPRQRGLGALGQEA